MRPIRPVLFVLTASAVLAGCGGSPPSSKAQEEIVKAVFVANTAMYEPTKETAEVVSIKMGDWEKQTLGQGVTLYNTHWTAKLRFKEPIACILAEVEGKNIVKIVADKGDELAFEGQCGGGKNGDKWDLMANAQSKNGGDFMGAGAWKPIYDKVEGLTMGYQVINNGMRVQGKFRRTNFDALSKLKPYIIEGSDEDKKMQAEAAERYKKQQDLAIEQQRQRQEAQLAEQKKLQEEAAERQRKYQEEQARIQAENAEKQRLAIEEQNRIRAENAEKQRLAAEEAKKKAEEAKHARLLAVMKPFQSKSGAVMTADAGPTMSSVITDCAIDEEKLTVTGHAIDLREIPFREFSFDGAVDDKGAFTLKPSTGDPIIFGAAGEKLTSRTGQTIAALNEADRAKVDAAAALGKRLSSAAPAELKVEVLDAALAKTREPQIYLSPLAGIVQYRGKVNPAVAPLFSGDMAAAKAYGWKGHEIVSIRLADGAKSPGLYIRGGGVPSDNLNITINGVHKVSIPSIPKLGGVIVAFPAGLEVFDIKLEAAGTVQSRTIGLIK